MGGGQSWGSSESNFFAALRRFDPTALLQDFLILPCKNCSQPKVLVCSVKAFVSMMSFNDRAVRAWMDSIGLDC